MGTPIGDVGVMNRLQASLRVRRCNILISPIQICGSSIEVPLPAYVPLRKIEAIEPAAMCMVVTNLSERKQRDEPIAAVKLAISILEASTGECN
jgi:hypothetical protein